MKTRLLCALIAALMLAACAGQPSPTPTALPPTIAPTATVPEPTVEPATATPEPPTATVSDATATPADPTQAAAQSTIQSVVVPTLPPPGTLVVGSSSSSSGDFRSLTFSQTGGDPKTTHTVKLTADGTLIVDGAATKVSPDVVTHVTDLLAKIDFFHIQGKFTGPSASPSGYQYSLDVETSTRGKTIFAQDGLMPPELTALFAEISALGSTPP